MNNLDANLAGNPQPIRAIDLVRAGLAKRQAAEKRFRFFGIAAIIFSLIFLLCLLISIVGKGYTAFQQTSIALDVYFDPRLIDPEGERKPDAIAAGDFGALVKQSLHKMFPEVTERRDKRALVGLVSHGATFAIRASVLQDPDLIGKTVRFWVPASDDVDMLIKGQLDRKLPESDRRLTDREIGWIEFLEDKELIEKQFNTAFFTSGDSRDPELAGIRSATVGTFFTLMITLGLSFPIGIATAVYLEEYASRNQWTDLIEVNINNLAAVPSIVFGLLGLAVFINFFGLPRSAPLVGGLVLTLITLPTIIIASRAALKSVPPSIREGALGVGASKMQMVIDHVLPLALPGMLTGTIIGMAHALGESAPLLMIGMVAFIVDIPGGITDPSTVLPVQIYLWADSAERAFVEKTSAAIMVLLLFLIAMNALAIVLRKRYEKRW
ncbi:MAG: phosphate ABC transporter permease PstA [Methylococcales bacterium]